MGPPDSGKRSAAHAISEVAPARRMLGLPLGALVVSHVAWDIWIFLIAPTEKAVV